ncbi:hypothetical protein J5751_07295 [bacterium]|nr:hypothetical protein [bacterium]
MKENKHFAILWPCTKMVLIIIGYGLAFGVLFAAIVFGIAYYFCCKFEYLFNFFWMLTSGGLLAIFCLKIISLFMFLFPINKKLELERKTNDCNLSFFLEEIFNNYNFKGEYYIGLSSGMLSNGDRIKNIELEIRKKIKQKQGMFGMLDYTGGIVDFGRCESPSVEKFKKVFDKEGKFFVLIKGFEKLTDKEQMIAHKIINYNDEMVAIFIINDIFIPSSTSCERVLRMTNKDCDVSLPTFSYNYFWSNYFLNCSTAYRLYKDTLTNSNVSINKEFAFGYGISSFETDNHIASKMVFEAYQNCNPSQFVDKAWLYLVFVMLAHGNQQRINEIKISGILESLGSSNHIDAITKIITKHWVEHLELEAGNINESLLNKYENTIKLVLDELNKADNLNNDSVYFLIYNFKHILSDFYRIKFILGKDISQTEESYVSQCFNMLRKTDYGLRYKKPINSFEIYFKRLNLDLYKDYNDARSKLPKYTKYLLETDYKVKTQSNSSLIIYSIENLIYRGKSVSAASLKSINSYLFEFNFDFSPTALSNNKDIIQMCYSICDSFIDDAVNNGDIVDSHIASGLSAKAHIMLFDYLYQVSMIVHPGKCENCYDELQNISAKCLKEVTELIKTSNGLYDNNYGRERNNVYLNIANIIKKTVSQYKGEEIINTSIYNFTIDNKISVDVSSNNDRFKLYRYLMYSLQSLIFYLQ